MKNLSDNEKERLELNGYEVRDDGKYITIQSNINTGTNIKELMLDCIKNNDTIDIKTGSEICHGGWYDLSRSELNNYKDDVNRICRDNGIWFCKSK